VPGTPGTPTGVAGNAQVTVTVAAGSGGTPTSYTVSASPQVSGVTRTCTVTGASGSCAVTGLTNGTGYTFTTTATNAMGTSGSSSASSSVTPAITCATGGTCILGNTGPGGGIVFYVQASSGTFTSTGSTCNTTCKYLEIAPQGWIVSSSPSGQINCGSAGGIDGTSTVDPKCLWSGNTATDVGAGASGDAIGAGHANTTAIISQSNTAGKAATVARAYQGGGLTDWYLPSLTELGEIATKWTSGTLTVGNSGLPSDYYWGSTVVNSTIAQRKNIQTAHPVNSPKTEAWYIRPIRAFG